MYIQELENISFLLLSEDGFFIISPMLFTFIVSPSKDSSYPNTFSSDLKSSVVDIAVDTPVQFKNWFTVLSVYVIFVERPEVIVPVVPNPTVESTVIILDPLLTFSIDLVLPVTSKVPVIDSSSSNPTNKSKIK